MLDVILKTINSLYVFPYFLDLCPGIFQVYLTLLYNIFVVKGLLIEYLSHDGINFKIDLELFEFLEENFKSILLFLGFCRFFQPFPNFIVIVESTFRVKVLPSLKKDKTNDDLEVRDLSTNCVFCVIYEQLTYF